MLFANSTRNNVRGRNNKAARHSTSGKRGLELTSREVLSSQPDILRPLDVTLNLRGALHTNRECSHIYTPGWSRWGYSILCDPSLWCCQCGRTTYAGVLDANEYGVNPINSEVYILHSVSYAKPNTLLIFLNPIRRPAQTEESGEWLEQCNNPDLDGCGF